MAKKTVRGEPSDEDDNKHPSSRAKAAAKDKIAKAAPLPLAKSERALPAKEKSSLAAQPLPQTKDDDAAPVPPPWSELRVAVIDDAMHPPSRDRVPDAERAALDTLLTEDVEVAAELLSWEIAAGSSVDEKLLGIASHGQTSIARAKLAGASIEAQRMVEEHSQFLQFQQHLEDEVEGVTVCDPYQEPLADLSQHNLILLDYYLDGSRGGPDRAIETARAIRAQKNRIPDQQIVLMSSLESVRQLRTQFREQTGIVGSAFAFIAKSDLDEMWKVKAHLAMLERARPYAPALTDYRIALEPALTKATEDLLAMVDDLDIGDYAFLQGRALMKDGHPLGDYVFWLLSSQLMAFAFEKEDMRERQRELDRLEFVGEPFAATEPSVLVANLFHSALVSRNHGPLGPHPRARPGSPYEQFPLVQLGDVFLDAKRTNAVVVLSADCDLAFAPDPAREPDGDTPVILVPGKPTRMKESEQELSTATAGILVSDEVYQVQWDFAKYRSVSLEELKTWLRERKFDVTNRDRLRPLFGLKLQQEFGAHLLRVGPPLMPPITSAAKARIYVCTPDKDEVDQLGADELMISRFKGLALVRVTPMLAGRLKRACEELHSRLAAHLETLKPGQKANHQKKIDSLLAKIQDDEGWIKMLEGLEMGGSGLKPGFPIAVARGTDWSTNKPCVVLEIREPSSAEAGAKAGSEMTGA